MTMEMSPYPGAQGHRGAELGTAPALLSWPGTATLSAPCDLWMRDPAGLLWPGQFPPILGVLLSPLPQEQELGAGELLALPCLRLQTQTRSWRLQSPRPLA